MPSQHSWLRQLLTLDKSCMWISQADFLSELGIFDWTLQCQVAVEKKDSGMGSVGSSQGRTKLERSSVSLGVQGHPVLIVLRNPESSCRIQYFLLVTQNLFLSFSWRQYLLCGIHAEILSWAVPWGCRWELLKTERWCLLDSSFLVFIFPCVCVLKDRMRELLLVLSRNDYNGWNWTKVKSRSQIGAWCSSSLMAKPLPCKRWDPTLVLIHVPAAPFPI